MSGADFQARARSLRARFDALADAEPGLRVRTMADRLGVAEVELLAAQCGDMSADRLDVRPLDLFRELGQVNEFMAVSRNPWCVHERTGRYQDVRIEGQIGVVRGPDIDLRMFFAHWDSVWLVAQTGRRSLQFFDHTGTAVHKTYATPNTDLAALQALVARHGAAAPQWPMLRAPAVPMLADRPDDPQGLRAGWLALRDTAQFFPLLRKYQVSRVGALRAVGSDLAQEVGAQSLERLLTQVSLMGLPVQCFVSNRGIVQIHTGPMYNLYRAGPWLHVQDERFNLHLNVLAVASAWVVNKPSQDGWLTSLEGYAENGELIVQFFGVRQPGRSEPRRWRDLLVDLCNEPLAC
ncbi:ChuX/HutX family heme-like substrate-binding protein [Orrella sp. JC864]|uniref:ChuX/HutX family heme-like substrate-binding protein n=1 Tax=Orrella sp. JC864 TaxID=3120298 RepID=UPI0012BB7331